MSRKESTEPGSLRSGFTTGSAAAAAAKAGLMILHGADRPKEVDIPLPDGGRLLVPLAEAQIDKGTVRACVIKDGGDDPDVTHGAIIAVNACRLGEAEPPVIDLNGGPGVGRVTKPGLPVRVGESAINPVPRDQIRLACLEALGRIGQTGHYQLLIEVPEGERLARKTMNPRLGVVGGISILGTRGTVLPFSSASYKGTIESELDVATAAGCHAVGLATGGRSERFLRSRVPGLSTDCLVLTADYFAFSLQQAAARGFASIHLACFFGKLVKMAQGHAYTHARTADLNFDQLAGWCADCGLADGTVRRIASANTARESLELIRQDTCLNRILEAVADRALAAARRFAGDGPAIGLHLFDFDGGLLWEAQTAGRHE